MGEIHPKFFKLFCHPTHSFPVHPRLPTPIIYLELQPNRFTGSWWTVSKEWARLRKTPINDWSRPHRIIRNKLTNTEDPTPITKLGTKYGSPHTTYATHINAKNSTTNVLANQKMNQWRHVQVRLTITLAYLSILPCVMPKASYTRALSFRFASHNPSGSPQHRRPANLSGESLKFTSQKQLTGISHRMEGLWSRGTMLGNRTRYPRAEPPSRISHQPPTLPWSSTRGVDLVRVRLPEWAL